MTDIIKKRGRPRKNNIKIDNISKPDTTNEENIVVYFGISDDENDNNEINVCTDEFNKNIINTDTDTVSETQHNVTIKQLLDEINLKDNIIAKLKTKQIYNNSKTTNISYHCVQLADSKTIQPFKPEHNNYKCWWCDETFTNMPAYIVNFFRNDTYYVFGNFCSFNCALKYNIKMLKDYKCNTRHALTYNLCIKVTNDDKHIKLAGDRELLKSKGGIYNIEEFRDGFSVITNEMQIRMPPIIPLVHIVD